MPILSVYRIVYWQCQISAIQIQNQIPSVLLYLNTVTVRLLFHQQFHFIGLTPILQLFSLRGGMKSSFRSHRRNKAFEQTEDCRLPVPFALTESARNSYQGAYEAPVTAFRASDVTSMASHFSSLKNSLLPSQFEQPEQQNSKHPSALLSSLHDLENKLISAKKLLKIKSNSFQSQSSALLISQSRPSTRREKQEEANERIETEESTINLQSQRRMIAMRNKEKFKWANKIKTYYISEIVNGMAGINEKALEHLNLSWDILKTCLISNLPNSKTIKRPYVHLPISPSNEGKKTLVIDLDETLIHYESERNSPDDIEVDIEMDDEMGKAYVSLRPYALSFLKRARKYFEIIIFTASDRSYADVILDEIDPDKALIDHRLYREHCVKLANQVYAKDLKIINRELSQTILVDNSPISYLYQLDNGVPILPYYGGEDVQLLHLEKYLEQVRKEKDVRRLNRATFKLWRYQDFNECESLVESLFCEGNGTY